MHEEQKVSNMTPQEQKRYVKELEAKLAAKEGDREIRSVGTKVISDLHRGHEREFFPDPKTGELTIKNPQFRVRPDTVQFQHQPKPAPLVSDAKMEENAFIMAAGTAALEAARLKK